ASTCCTITTGAGKSAGNCASTLASAAGPPADEPIATKQSCVFSTEVAGGAPSVVAGFGRPPPSRRRIVSIFASRAAPPSPPPGCSQYRLFDCVHPPPPHPLKNLRRIIFPARRDCDDGTGCRRHDPARRLSPVHVRHDQIHQDEVGRIVGAMVNRLFPI